MHYFLNSDMAAKKHKVLWEDSGFPFDNVPFVVVNHKVYDCQHGVDRHLCEKKRNQAVSFYGRIFLSWKRKHRLSCFSTARKGLKTREDEFRWIISLSSHKLALVLIYSMIIKAWWKISICYCFISTFRVVTTPIEKMGLANCFKSLGNSIVQLKYIWGKSSNSQSSR